ncbi:hypothetical protein SKUN_001750 (plasmid) [Spiroplasma kunkelii CR2-3x]|uniref:Uncharacterized protein n=1 Tax=Spiroplasma kunkelii CR2-3x TaxID=273035 RepID=A0A0K2JK04_SPIKU|nr:hypothetical protein SKUN_001750 [Spiroplasma kunkelii CR2-3x]
MKKSGEDPLFKLIKTNQYYKLLNESIKIIKSLIGKKYIIIFYELDRCTTLKMIEFLSIIKNILFNLNNCFLLLVIIQIE